MSQCEFRSTNFLALRARCSEKADRSSTGGPSRAFQRRLIAKNAKASFSRGALPPSPLHPAPSLRLIVCRSPEATTLSATHTAQRNEPKIAGSRWNTAPPRTHLDLDLCVYAELVNHLIYRCEVLSDVSPRGKKRILRRKRTAHRPHLGFPYAIIPVARYAISFESRGRQALAGSTVSFFRGE